MFGRRKAADIPEGWQRTIVTVDLAINAVQQRAIAADYEPSLSTRDSVPTFLDGHSVIVVGQAGPLGTVPPRLVTRILAHASAAAEYAEGVDIDIEVLNSIHEGRRIVAQVPVPGVIDDLDA